MRYHTPPERCGEWSGRIHKNAGDGILKHDRVKKGIPYQSLCGIIGIALVRKQVINLVRCFA